MGAQAPAHLPCPSPDDRLLPEIATFFVAGTDTTAHTMTWTLYLVAQHPEVEARLCAELDALGLLATPQVRAGLCVRCPAPCHSWSSNAAAPRVATRHVLLLAVQRPEPRMVEVEDLSRLVYLAAVVKVNGGGGGGGGAGASAAMRDRSWGSVGRWKHVVCGETNMWTDGCTGSVNKDCLTWRASAFMQESMRVLPVSADGTAIQAPRDIQLGPHTIPAKWVPLPAA